MLRIDRRLLSHIEWPLFLLAVMVTAIGLCTIFSATYRVDQGLSSHVVRQLTWAGLGLVLMLIAIGIDYRTLSRYAYPIYAALIVALILTLFLGTKGGGARRWLGYGPLALQPSEFMKVGLVLVLAHVLHRWAGEPRLALRRLIGPAILIAIPAFLILKQPDLGTVIALAMGAFTLLMVAGLPVRLLVIAALVLAPFGKIAFDHLKPYQKNRLISFRNPEADPLGTGYHVLQSQIAIGSGQVHGKGYLNGTQNKLSFLPEQHTDFIFSVYAEEWGFLGATALLLLYLGLVLRGAYIASRARDNLGALLAAGLTGTIFWQAVINIGMTSGALPVVGITLPFLSYGGSSMLALLASVGLLMNISMRRYTF
ncbi:MAG: rod shape-determining protein RodA [Deltaproteobacteria bacterium]|nr:rod shape-determining protein RodA [Deltaproteobacteria bacterium]